MKKTTLLLIIILTANASIFSQKVPSLAPLNPDFVNYIAKLNSGESLITNSDTFSTGGMPPPCLVSFDDYLNNTNLKSTTFASVYDMRTTGLLTPVRGQTSNGCWAFATMGSVESEWLVQGLGSWDLSENNLKYCNGFVDSRCYYGNHWMSTAYFARRSGALIESDDPNVGGSPGPGQCPIGKIPVAYITDARYLPHNSNAIKQAILDQGAIYTMLYYISTCYNPANYTYYYNGAPQVNHAVDLVGWDDTKVTAGGTGAWICKNSYGPGWGEAGFFYVSYNDKSILDYNAYWPVRFDNILNSKVYGYDDLGNYISIGYGQPVGYTLVKFIATGKQLLSKVGTYAMAANSSMEIDVYDNFNPATKVLSGLLLHQTALSCAMPGYYTFNLTSPLIMEQGNDFYIRVRYQTPSNNNPIPIEKLISGYGTPFIESNVSWVSDNGSDGSWFLIGNSTSNYKWDPCIKVYAESLRTWTGNHSEDWNNAENWAPETIPDEGTNTIIPNVLHKPSVNQSPATPAICNNLTIGAGSAVTINSGKALTVNGTLNNNAGNSGLIVESGASLLTKGIVIGSATVKREVIGNEWHLISSPISNAVSDIFVGKYLQQYNEATDTYQDIISETERLIVSAGYAVFNATPFIATYSGLLNTGSIGDIGNLSNDGLGWNLVGNPYPSFIDWDATGWTKTNVSNAIYSSVNSSTWASYVGGIGTNGGSQFIAPCQGYFVHVVGDIPGTLTSSNKVRVHNNAAFYKNSTENMVRLMVSGNGYSDETVVRFMSEATSGFDDRYDAVKLFGDVNDAAQLYTVGNMPLSINSLPETNNIMVGLRASTSSIFAIAATEIKGIGNLTLEDLKTHTFTDLLKGSYLFSFTPGENEQRFTLHFGSLSMIEKENSIANIYSFKKTVFIDLNMSVKGDIYIYTLTGQLASNVLSAEGSKRITLENSGIYIVKLIMDKSTIVKKLWVN
jgi:C1A family cysteine protease